MCLLKTLCSCCPQCYFIHSEGCDIDEECRVTFVYCRQSQVYLHHILRQLLRRKSVSPLVLFHYTLLTVSTFSDLGRRKKWSVRAVSENVRRTVDINDCDVLLVVRYASVNIILQKNITWSKNLI